MKLCKKAQTKNELIRTLKYNTTYGPFGLSVVHY
jgi:hypothetical protein